METYFITIKDKNEIYRPAFFIRRNDTAGKMAADRIKLNNGDELVLVKFEEIGKHYQS